MTSRFGWLDHDDAQRAKMLELVKWFQDPGSVDELGIGPIRDAFSNAFFPGTSVLHTRVRYLLFVPWLCQEVARRGLPLDQARAELKTGEVRLIKALLNGGETTGVIGSQAQDELKTMPSQVFWPALDRLDLLRWDTSIDGYFRTASQRVRRRSETVEGDVDSALDLGFAALPQPPEAWLSSATFDLSADEAGALRDVFLRLPSSSVLHWLAGNARSASGRYVWEHPQLAEMPEAHRSRIDHARRLHHSWYGAPLLYNLMVARLGDDLARTAQYEAELDDWTVELDQHGVLRGWDRPAFWALVRELNPRLSRATVDFVDRWASLAAAGQASSVEAQELIRRRELRLKGPRRARLWNADARAGWSGYAGLVRLDYRWGVAQRFLADVLAGLEHADPEDAQQAADEPAEVR